MSPSEFEGSAVSGRPHALELVLQEMGAAIAESQAALLAGRVRDLEASTRRQKQLWEQCEQLRARPNSAGGSSGGERGTAWPSGVLASARQLHARNLVFAGILKRMRRNLEALQQQMQGAAPAYTYARGRERNGRALPERTGTFRV